MLEACKKEYQKLYLEQENLKKKYKEQQEELLKNIKSITRVEQQTKLQLLRIERLNLAISTLTKKN